MDEEIEGAPPLPDEATSARERAGVALCLSGGGFRAALFHLGALRRLNELGVLSRVDTISAVSGGSLIAAHLSEAIATWPEPGATVPDWDAVVAAPFRAFTQRNLRTGPLLARALPWNWTKPEIAVEKLADRLRKLVTGRTLAELPERPQYIFSATDMIFGVNWVFEQTRAGDYQAGYIAPGAEWPVARAVAASSCFPPVFAPMQLHLEPGALKRGANRGADRDELVAQLQLTDGGVYDNMALEPVWKNHQTVLVSDGGAVFDFNSESNVLQRLLRYPAIVGKQAASIRRRWLVAGLATGRLAGAYWDIAVASDTARPPGGYSAAFVNEVISQIRTDLDAFSEVEIAVLENHGYLEADRALKARVSDLIGREAPVRVPFPEWLDDEAHLRDRLKGSDKRTLLGRY